MNTFIQQEHIKRIKSDSKEMYNVTKDFHIVWNFLFIKESQQNVSRFQQKKKQKCFEH